MKLILSGDLHIGRGSSRLPDKLDARRFSGAAAWGRIVDFAIDEGARAVLLSGDVVDRANRFYEAYGPLEIGLNRLADEGIDVFAVTGNHDFDVLGRLKHSLASSRFHLLGEGGHWERFTLKDGDGQALHLDGWSFPREVVREDPLAGYRLPPSDNPIIGLLHADLNVPGSRYAPVQLATLQATTIQGWLLGHIHAPMLHHKDGCPWVLYPGSPIPLDPGEPGVHGPWMLEIEPGRKVRPVPLALSPVRYETIPVDLAGKTTAEERDQAIINAMRARMADATEDGGPLEYFSFRIQLTGRTTLHGALHAQDLTEMKELEVSQGSLASGVDKVILDTRPALDLAAEARGQNIKAELANLLLALEGDMANQDIKELISKAMDGIQSLHASRSYQVLPSEDFENEIDPEAIRGHLTKACWSLLDVWSDQKAE